MNRVPPSKKIIFIIPILIGISVVVYFLLSNTILNTKKEISRQKVVTEVADADLRILEQDLEKDYYIENKDYPKQFPFSDNNGQLKLNIEKYCKEKSDQLLCGYFSEIYGGFIKKKNDPKALIILTFKYASSKEKGIEFYNKFSEIFDNSNQKCIGGILHNKERTRFIYGYVDSGYLGTEFNKMFENLRLRTGYEYMYLCPPLK